MKAGLVVVSAFRFLTVFGMTWLGRVVRSDMAEWAVGNDMVEERSSEMTLLSGEVSLDARGCVA